MNVDKLAKVLALAASDNDAEAVHALRTARRLLDSEGVDFVELARRLSSGADGTGAVAVERLEDTIFDLRNEVRHLRSENERLKRQAADPAAAPSSLAPSAMPTSLSQAAEAAASAIRLSALLAETSAELEAERARILQMEAAAAHHARQMAEAGAESARLAARVSELESRRQRLEAENRRLGNLSHALKAELDERNAVRPAPATPRPVVEPRKPRRTGKRPAAPGQYALL